MPLPSSIRALETLTPQQWLERASRTLPQVLSVLFVVAIAWQLVQLTWLLLERRAESAEALPLPAPAVSPAARNQGPDIQAIADAHIFGTQQAEDVDAASAEATTVPLVLSAVFATNDPQKGFAIIGDSAAASNVYATGQAVRPGMTLHSVYHDRVIFDRGGRMESLMLPVQSLGGVQISSAPARPQQSQFQDNLRRIAETNPSAFTEIIRPQPVFANGVQRGYRVYPGRNRQQFAKLGLQPGDLVVSINGTPLDDPQRGMEIFNTLGSSDRVTVTVERNGQSQDLTLNTAQVMLPDAGQGQPPPAQPPGVTRGPTTPPNGGETH
ncbi:MAG TPA: type II secretion system protein GspC [Povalibacter sp.]